jgi:hypothetical protein
MCWTLRTFYVPVVVCTCHTDMSFTPQETETEVSHTRHAHTRSFPSSSGSFEALHTAMHGASQAHCTLRRISQPWKKPSFTAHGLVSRTISCGSGPPPDTARHRTGSPLPGFTGSTSLSPCSMYAMRHAAASHPLPRLHRPRRRCLRRSCSLWQRPSSCPRRH